jgi:uncharacterized membrane protein
MGIYATLHALVHECGLLFKFGGMSFLGLIINLVLAFIPVVIACYMRRGIDSDVAVRKRARWWIWGPVGLVWLLFLPNTAYVLTDWRHYLAAVAGDPR